MFKKDTILIVLITVFIVTPAVLALSAYFITKNPSLRPLGITVDQLSRAGQLENKSIIFAVVDIGTDAPRVSSNAQYKTAIETAFSRLNSEVQVQFRSIPGSSKVNITYLVGESQIGPFPSNRAAEGVLLAIEAEKLVVSHRRSVEKEKLRQTEIRDRGFWSRLFD